MYGFVRVAQKEMHASTVIPVAFTYEADVSVRPSKLSLYRNMTTRIERDNG